MRIAHLSWSSVAANARRARPGPKPSTGIDSSPESSSSVPAALAQLNLNVVLEIASPSALTTSRPGHANSFVRFSRKSLNGSQLIWARAKTAMTMR